MTDHIGEANEKVVDLLENLAGADEVTDAVYVLFNGQLRHWRDAMNDAADLLRASARRDAEEIERLRAALKPFARLEVLEPNGVIVGLERLHFERARAAHPGEG